ncbi:MAG: hypothetical protein QOC77_1692 [Thermoleophilaceae bacterium]|jgi:hypothetical protein|nr:hypothetical protein [Thermoleophilaceae bacterium]
MVRIAPVRLWQSGIFRLIILAAAVAAGVLLVEMSRSSSAPSAAQRAAASRAELRKLHGEQARIRAAERRDPALRRERARLRAEQRPHFDRARAAAAWPLVSHSQQDGLVRALERSITRDALARWHAGELNARVHGTVCVHLVRPNTPRPPPPPLSAAQAGYECTAVTTSVPATSRTKASIIGFPFWARVNFRARRYAWCKVNLLPSEHGIGDELAFVPLAPVCDVLPHGGPA